MQANTGLMPFHAMEILAEAKALEARGQVIRHLEVGEPAVTAAPAVLAAVRSALDQPQRYTHAKGMIELRQGLCRHYADQHGVTVDPDSVVVTMGSSSGFILAFLGAFGRGAKVAVTRPGYPAYLNTMDGLGLTAVEIPLTAANGWRLTGADIEAAYRLTPFEGLLFASPANPTGAAVDRAGLEEIVATCRTLGVTLISDEIYHGLDYRGASVSALEFGDDAVVINSFSKYYCMTGWRVGWMVVPERHLRRVEMLQQNLFISAPSLSQVAATVALGERGYSEVQKAGYARNRTLINEGLRRIGFDTAHESEGAFYAYVDVSRFTNDSLRFCKSMLAGAGVAATPGIDFDRVNGNRFVRFSYAGAAETITDALGRLEGWLRARA